MSLAWRSRSDSPTVTRRSSPSASTSAARSSVRAHSGSTSDGRSGPSPSTAQRMLSCTALLGRDRVAGLAGLEERPVPRDGLAEPVGGREHEAVVALGAPEEPLDLVDEAPSPARAVARRVELPPLREIRVDVALAGEPPEPA